MPEGLLYDKGFMWARLEGDSATVGLIDYAQKLAGDISFVDMPFVGDEVVQGKEVGSVETGKWVGKLYAPFSGKITEINEKLCDDATAINKDPFGAGWMFKIEVKDASESGKLMDEDAAAAWLRDEIKKRK